MAAAMLGRRTYIAANRPGVSWHIFFLATACLVYGLCYLFAWRNYSYFNLGNTAIVQVGISASNTSTKKQISPASSKELYKCIEAALDDKGAWPIAEWTWKQNDISSLSESTIAIPSNRTGEYCWKAEHKFTWDDAIARLEGKHLVMFGDSLTRYQYMSLAFFLENKK